MSDPSADAIEREAHAILEAIRPRRRTRPRLAEPLHDAEARTVATPFGAVMAWRLDPWGAPATTPAVLLVHGWEDDNALWGPLIERLMLQGRSVVALDLPGHGFSPAHGCSIGRAAAAIRTVAEALGLVDGLVAHSFGCPASTQAMADGLNIARAVLIATPLPTGDGGDARWTRIQQRLDASDAAIARARALAVEQEAKFPPFDYVALAHAMTAEALFLHALDDGDCPPQNSRTLADAWPGAQCLFVDDLGHRALAQDARTLDIVTAFLG